MNLQQIQTAVSAVPGIEFRSPLPGQEVNAIAYFERDAGGMSAAVDQFKGLCARIDAIGQRLVRGAHLPPEPDDEASYRVGDLRVFISVTGGAYSSAPQLGFTAEHESWAA